MVLYQAVQHLFRSLLGSANRRYLDTFWDPRFIVQHPLELMVAVGRAIASRRDDVVLVDTGAFRGVRDHRDLTGRPRFVTAVKR